MIDIIQQTLDKIEQEPRSLRTFVAQYAADTRDIGFFLDLDRFREGRAILSFLADTERCRRFFDMRYEDITAVLTDMWAA